MKRYTDEWWQGVKDFNNSFPINIFKRDKEMTANELADWIENGAPFGDYETAKQASAMLRQQQAEIEALKKDLALKTRDRDVFANFTLAYEKRIEELEKGSGWLEETDEQVIANAEKRFPFLKRRELTYEEISDIRNKHLAPKDCDIYTFAKAILQKASEK
jgi:hypothetical protein